MLPHKSLYTRPALYDAIHGAIDTGVLFHFYSNIIAKYGTPALELGCGTGRLLVSLVRQGMDVIGLDSSRAMLRAAQRKGAANGIAIQAAHADMRCFNLRQRFSTILCPANSFQHLLNYRDIDCCLSRVHKHLKPSGRLVLDVFNPSLELLMERVPRHVPTADAGVATLSHRYEADKQINHVTYVFNDAATGVQSALTFSMRQLFPEELMAVLAHNGFNVEKRFGDYDGSRFTASSPRQVLICRAGRT